jgi:hypothetical protein
MNLNGTVSILSQIEHILDHSIKAPFSLIPLPLIFLTFYSYWFRDGVFWFGGGEGLFGGIGRGAGVGVGAKDRGFAGK